MFAARRPPLRYGPMAASAPAFAFSIAIEAAIGAARRKGHIMTTIGTFTKTGDGFTGNVATLTLDANVQVKPAEKRSEKAASATGARHLERHDIRLHVDGRPRFCSKDDRELGRRTCASHKGLFHFSPTSTTSRSRRRFNTYRQGLGGERRAHRRSAPAQHLLGNVGTPDVRQSRRGRDRL